MTRNRALVTGLVLVLAAVALSLWAYPALPDQVATHWDLSGNVNGFSSRPVAVSVVPAIVGLMWVLMLVLPAVSPRGFRLDGSESPFYIAMLALGAVLVLIHFEVLRAALAQSAPAHTLVFASIGVLFAILGTVLGRTKKNFWFGVRTPWTLANDEVWMRTNRLAGKLFVAGGLVIVVASFLGNAAVGALPAVSALVAIVSIAYSYLLYRRIEGFGSES